jgi:hypothetical protein
MSFALLIVGVVLLTSAVLNTQSTLWGLLKNDFSGPSNFWYWLILLLILGAIGYIPKAKPISNAFLLLLIVVIFLSKGGFFTQFTSAIQGTTTTPTAAQTTGVPAVQPLQPLQGLSNAGSLGGGVPV